MHADYSSRSWGYQLFHSLWIEAVCLRINVAKDRRDLLPLKRVGCGYESEGRDNDFALQLQGANCDFKTDGCVADGNAMRDAGYFSDSFLKLADVSTSIG